MHPQLAALASELRRVTAEALAMAAGVTPDHRDIQRKTEWPAACARLASEQMACRRRHVLAREDGMQARELHQVDPLDVDPVEVPGWEPALADCSC